MLVDGQTFNDSLSDITSNLLYFGSTHFRVRPLLEQPRSALESGRVRPVITQHNPLEITNGGMDWVQFKSVEIDSRPLQKVTETETYTIVTSDSTNKYAIKGAEAILVDSQEHPGLFPYVSLYLPDEMIIARQCYLKQLQHLQVESALTDAAVMAGTIQRLYTPAPSDANDDPRYVKPKQDFSSLKTDNAHLLIGGDFKFVESSGAALGNLMMVLEKTEEQIRDIVSKISRTPIDNGIAQSGLSKQVDDANTERSLLVYRIKIAQTLERLLSKVGEVVGIEPPQVTLADISSTSVEG